MFKIAFLVLFCPSIASAQQKDTSHVRMLLELCDNYLQKESKFDTCRLLIQQVEAMSNDLHFPIGEGKAALMWSKLFRLQKQPDKGQPYLKKAFAIFTKYDYKDGLAEAWIESADYQPYTDEGILIEIENKEKAIALFEKAGNIKRMGDAEVSVGDHYADLGKYPESWVHLNRALHIYQNIGFNKSLEGLYDLLGVVATLMGDFQEGLRYGLLAVKTARENNDTSLVLCTIYNRVGITYVKVSDFKEAYKYYMLALEIAEKYHDESSIKLVTDNIVNVSPKVGKLKEGLAMQQELDRRYPGKIVEDKIFRTATFLGLYREMNNFRIGQQYCDRLLALSATVKPDATIQYVVYKTVIRFYITSKQFDKAYKYIAINDTFSRKRNARQDLAENYYSRFKVDSALGKFSSAIVYLQKARLLNDSLFNDRKNLQFTQLRVRYETEQKDQDIKMKGQNIQLLTKKGELQQSLLDKERTRRNAIIGGAVMLLLLMGLGYNRYRLKQRSNIRLQAQQVEINQQNHSLQKLLTEKEWLLKEIHHRVKNNLQFIISLLNIQSAYLDNEEAVSAIRESQSRMYAMSLIHQKLYQSDEIAVINMERYIREMISYLTDSMVFMSQIHFELEIDPIELEATQAAPLGLILNETITNAIKYAFPDGRAGIITIKLLYTDTEEIMLSIADNGIGWSKELKKQGSLGMTLIEMLSEQLEGTLSITSDNGVAIVLMFKEENLYILGAE